VTITRADGISKLIHSRLNGDAKHFHKDDIEELFLHKVRDFLKE